MDATFKLSSLQAGDSLASEEGPLVVELLELKSLKRGLEWPAAFLAFAIYSLWLLTTFFYRDLQWWVLTPLGAWIIAWQLNLQHETIHGHPTRNRRVNEMIGRWPLSLWLPYSIYRSTHLAHHRDENLTDPLDDPESYYWEDGQWRALGPLGRALVAAQSTLLGRMILGPVWTTSRFVRGLARDVWRSKGNTRAIVARHLLECAAILIWVLGVCGMPFWVYVACFVYPGVSSSSFAPSPSIAPSRRWASERRLSRMLEFSGRFSCSTTCMLRTTCAAGCPGIKSRNSIASIAQP